MQKVSLEPCQPSAPSSFPATERVHGPLKHTYSSVDAAPR